MSEQMSEQLRKSIYEAKYDYDYGNLPDLRPGSKTSKFICSQIQKRKRFSRAQLASRHPEWRKLVQKRNLLVPLTSVEKKLKAKDPSLPLATIVPHMLSACDTYLSAYEKDYVPTILDRFEGYGSAEAITAAVLREQIIAEADAFFKNHLAYFAVMEKMLTYGFGVATARWRRHRRSGVRLTEVTGLISSMLRDQGMTAAQIGDYIETKEKVVEFEGTEVLPLDNWNIFLDPSVTPNKFNQSEYWGFLWTTNPFELLSMESDKQSGIINAKYARLAATGGMGRDPEFNNGPIEETSLRRQSLSSGATDDGKETLHVTCWEQLIIPEEWGLPGGSEPMVWKFWTLSDIVVLMAEPCDNDHQLFNGAMMASTTDGTDMFPVSLAARTFGISEGVDWMIRSRMHEVMATGSKFLYHPLYVDIEEYLDGGPMAAIPLRPQAWHVPGPIDQFFKQLEFRNVTAGHFGDIASLLEIAKDADGTIDIVKGDMSSLPERPGQMGVAGAMAGAASKIRYFLRKAVMQAHWDLGYIKGCNLDEFMSKTYYLDAVGKDNDRDLREIFGADAVQIEVRPDDLFYSRAPDGRIQKHQWRLVPPDNRSAGPENFQSMMQFGSILYQNPLFQQQLAADFDITQFTIRLAELGGIGYARSLLKKRQAPMAMGMISNQGAEQGLQSGNLITQQQANQMLQEKGMAA